MIVTFFGYRRCKTSNSVEASLKAAGVVINFIDIIKEPPDLSVLKRLVEKYGPGGAVRRDKESAERLYKRLGLEAYLKRLRLNPSLLVRPIVIADGEIYAGRDALKLAAPRGVKEGGS